MSKDRNCKSTKYLKWRLYVYEKDGWKCQHCGSESRLHAHHVIEWDKDISLRYEVSNGLTLCSSCHFKIHHKNDERIPWNKGKKMSAEYRKKLSDAHAGQVPWNKGKKMPVEAVEKMRKSKTGKKIQPFTEEHKIKIGIANKEILAINSAWRKGKTWFKDQITGKRIWIEKESNHDSL